MVDLGKPVLAIAGQKDLRLDPGQRLGLGGMAGGELDPCQFEPKFRGPRAFRRGFERGGERGAGRIRLAAETLGDPLDECEIAASRRVFGLRPKCLQPALGDRESALLQGRHDLAGQDRGRPVDDFSTRRHWLRGRGLGRFGRAGRSLLQSQHSRATHGPHDASNDPNAVPGSSSHGCVLLDRTSSDPCGIPVRIGREPNRNGSPALLFPAAPSMRLDDPGPKVLGESSRRALSLEGSTANPAPSASPRRLRRRNTAWLEVAACWQNQTNPRNHKALNCKYLRLVLGRSRSARSSRRPPLCRSRHSPTRWRRTPVLEVFYDHGELSKSGEARCPQVIIVNSWSRCPPLVVRRSWGNRNAVWHRVRYTRTERSRSPPRLAPRGRSSSRRPSSDP